MLNRNSQTVAHRWPNAFLAACLAVGGIVAATPTSSPSIEGTNDLISQVASAHNMIMQEWPADPTMIKKGKRGASRACGGDGMWFGANDYSYNCF